jgi:hypothetical protein
MSPVLLLAAARLVTLIFSGNPLVPMPLLASRLVLSLRETTLAVRRSAWRCR